MKLGYLFATPLAEFQAENEKPLCDDLRTLFLEKESDEQVRNEIRRDTQHGELFESRFDLFEWQDPPVKELTQFCHRALASTIFELSDYSDEEFSGLQFNYHAWFHITRNGGFQALHHHQNASWSGIFCVDPGDDVEANPHSGAVRFYDPRGQADQYRDPGNSRLGSITRFGSYEISHRAGRLLIFPSYLDHEIFPYLGQRERIVVAFNCMLQEG